MSCLTPEQMELMVRGAAEPSEADEVRRHVEQCVACRRKLDERLANEELLGYLRQLPPTALLESRPPGSPSVTVGTDSIPGYEIIGEIHRGGQGVVYKAIQKSTKRTVALKVLLGGRFASPRQRGRFEREIDLIASLQHRNIVAVYDSGVAPDGQPYFAMEYIHGVPLDGYLRAKRQAGSTSGQKTVRDLLRLFSKICAAVGYAHRHGVIHRDLKPGNILIDAEGEPHILDLGLAKAAGPALTEQGRPITVTSEFMGTLAYASPEQVTGDPTLVDIRTDVYSLGVILYEMLTGTYPYPVVGQMADVLRNIAETPPHRPARGTGAAAAERPISPPAFPRSTTIWKPWSSRRWPRSAKGVINLPTICDWTLRTTWTTAPSTRSGIARSMSCASLPSATGTPRPY